MARKIPMPTPSRDPDQLMQALKLAWAEVESRTARIAELEKKNAALRDAVKAFTEFLRDLNKFNAKAPASKKRAGGKGK